MTEDVIPLAPAASGRRIKLLAIASGGGHWVQLRRLRPAWDDCDVTYVTTKSGYRREVMDDAKARSQNQPAFHTVTDANRWQKLRLVRQLLEVLWVLVKVRPDVVISTGAAPGFFGLKFGKFLGASTIWVDSIANAETLSLSGEKAGGCADLWLTQWKHLAGSRDSTDHKPRYKGTVV